MVIVLRIYVFMHKIQYLCTKYRWFYATLMSVVYR